MKANRVTARVLTPPRTTARTQWSILDTSTQQCRLVSADECFPIAGRLLSGVWQLDDGRVLMATSTDDGDRILRRVGPATTSSSSDAARMSDDGPRAIAPSIDGIVLGVLRLLPSREVVDAQ